MNRAQALMLLAAALLLVLIAGLTLAAAILSRNDQRALVNAANACYQAGDRAVFVQGPCGYQVECRP